MKAESDRWALTDPLELYSYPQEWVEKRAEEEGIEEVRGKIGSGLYVLTVDGWLHRGITTGTTASAAAIAAIASICEEVDEVEVMTPSGLKVGVKVDADNGVAEARKFAGDHEFDVTDGLLFRAFTTPASESGVRFGRGVGRYRDGRFAVSRAAMEQIRANIRDAVANYDYHGGVRIEVPEGERVAALTGNHRVGVEDGISILGTTGFVEPWCRRLVEVKAAIASQYERVAVTTGRNGWRWCMKNLRGHASLVFGMYIEEGLRATRTAEDVVLVGKPSLLLKWAEPSLQERLLNPEYSSGREGKQRPEMLELFGEIVLQKAREINPRVRRAVLLGVGEWAQTGKHVRK